MAKSLPYIIVLLLVAVVAWITWDMKPPEYRDKPVYQDRELTSGDSARIVSEGTKGLWVGTDAEAIQKFGRKIKSYYTVPRDSTVPVDSMVYDTTFITIPFLESEDSARFSGYNVLDGDSISYSLVSRVHTEAYWEPANTIITTIYLDSLTMSLPVAPKRTVMDNLRHGAFWLAIWTAIWELVT